RLSAVDQERSPVQQLQGRLSGHVAQACIEPAVRSLHFGADQDQDTACQALRPDQRDLRLRSNTRPPILEHCAEGSEPRDVLAPGIRDGTSWVRATAA